jgi:hypothetical protein
MDGPARLAPEVDVDGLVCVLPGRRVQVGLPTTLAVWMVAASFLILLLTVPAASWPEGTRMVVGGLVGATTVVGALPLWMFLNAEMFGERGRVLRATSLGVDVVSRRHRHTAPLTPAAGRSPGYVFARWSAVTDIVADEHAITLVLHTAMVSIPAEGLTRMERDWLVLRLRELARTVDAGGEIPRAMAALQRQVAQ